MLTKKLEDILLKVDKPARYIGNELHIAKKDVNKVKARFAFAFPDLYEVGMSHLGLQILYDVINKKEDFYCERVFAPASDMEKIMRDENMDLFTIETKTPLAEMDIVGFTLQYELSYTNILNMLDLANIPLDKTERKEKDPFIIAGGPCAYNPEPLADIIDVFVLGEGEEIMVDLLNKYIEWKEKDLTKKDFYKMISDMEGIYIPSFYEVLYNEDLTIKSIEPNEAGVPRQVTKTIIADLETVNYPEKPIVPFIETIHNRAMVEIFRGCTRGCRFCQAGFVYRPIRERKRETIEQKAFSILANTGFEELSLASLSTSDYPEIELLVKNLMSHCGENNISLSLPSLRLDSFSFDVLNEIQKVKKSGLTFAPEAGTQRLRDVVNKSITDDNIYGAAKEAFELGWNNMKLYFMVGLPTETYEDLDGIAKIASNVIRIFRETGRNVGKLNVTISISNFVPKAQTAYQWFPQDTIESFKEKHDYLAQKMRMKHVSFHYHDANTSFLEAVFARGDRRVGKVLINAFKLGCKFDSWGEFFNFKKWTEAFEISGIDPDFYANRERSYEEILPWEHLSAGVDKTFLISENQKSLEGVTTVDCRKGCVECGVNKNIVGGPCR